MSLSELQELILLQGLRAVEEDLPREFDVSYAEIMEKHFRIRCLGRGFWVCRTGPEQERFRSASTQLSRSLRQLEELGLASRVKGHNGKGVNLTEEGIAFARKITGRA